jgi:regulation of enolase protein 1 (concanavalin A-like superfamily)
LWLNFFVSVREVRGKKLAIIFKEKKMEMAKKRLFCIMPAAALAFGVMACDPGAGSGGDVPAGTV